jgi:hypothetical protein
MFPLKSSWVLQSPGKPYSIQTDASIKENGEDSLRFEVRSGETWRDASLTKSFRAEVATETFPPIKSKRWYSFSVFLPADFPIENNRFVFAQWHGENMEAHGQPPRSPPLAFRFRKGRLIIDIQHSDAEVIPDPDAVPTEVLLETKDFALGQWHDFFVEAKWSYAEDGLVNVWRNGRQVVAYRGPVGYRENVGPQFKFGIYRNDSARTYIAYFNHVKEGATMADVGFTSPNLTGPGKPNQPSEPTPTAVMPAAGAPVGATLYRGTGGRSSAD